MSKTRMIDGGTLSPKVTIPTSVLVLAGAVLGVLDATGILDLDDSLWIALLGAGGVTGATGYAAKPGAVVKDERGYSLVELLAVLFIAVLLLLVLLAVLDRL